ncbi:chromate efflux transporter [Glaciecola sp. MH2013]|uniref:chromate efflux transporter n=1 Tax=Glaciecola sp. MH2013 TaxID=2785524 RepID=UPI00189C6810|nr:chromate efflux transporter [Glaciecola sp. MH2013]MBF7074137.1 chromate efflux transporter [Glaciecola sp. MH2013]
MTVGPLHIFLSFLKLGFTAFGGPVAHLAFFRAEFVEAKKWLSEEDYTELVALCQFLPGPASSQVGLAIGYLRGGYLGSVLAWTAFTLPSAIILVILALSYSSLGSSVPTGLLLGLKAVTVAVVVQALWGMSRAILISKLHKTIAVVSAVSLLYFNLIWLPIVLIACSALVGLVLFKSESNSDAQHPSSSLFDHISKGRKSGFVWLSVFVVSLITLALLAHLYPDSGIALFDAFFRTGAMVFGGGHVVLPLLEVETVQRAWIEKEAFLVGYGATQAMPGPVFTFSAYLGALSNLPAEHAQHPSFLFGVELKNALLALLGIFLPSFFMVYAALPFWKILRTNTRIKSALIGINACVVGILLAALYDPIITTALGSLDGSSKQIIAILFAYLALAVWKLPPWLVVIAGALLGLIYY